MQYELTFMYVHMFKTYAIYNITLTTWRKSILKIVFYYNYLRFILIAKSIYSKLQYN